MFGSLRRGLLFVVGFSLPVEGLGAFQIAGYPVTPNKLVTALLLVVAVFAWALTGRSLPWNRKHLWVVAFALAVAMGGVVSVGRGFPASDLFVLWTSYIAVFLFYFLIPFVVTRVRDLDWLLGGLVAGACFAVAGGAFYAGEGTSERYTGTSDNPNGLSANLVLALPVMFSFLFATRSAFKKVALFGAVALSVGGIVASLSRSAVVALAGMWGLWMVRFRRLDNIKYLLPTIVVALGILVFAPRSFEQRMDTLTGEERAQDYSIQKRLLMWYWGGRGFLSSPLIGLGTSRAGIYANERDPRIGRLHVVHNVFLGIAAELGLMGLVPFVGIFALTWRDYTRVWRGARAPPYREDPILRLLGHRALFLQISFAGAVTVAQFGFAVRWKGLWLLFGLSSALVALASERMRELGHSGARAAETVPSFGPRDVRVPAR